MLTDTDTHTQSHTHYSGKEFRFWKELCTLKWVFNNSSSQIVIHNEAHPRRFNLSVSLWMWCDCHDESINMGQFETTNMPVANDKRPISLFETILHAYLFHFSYAVPFVEQNSNIQRCLTTFARDQMLCLRFTVVQNSEQINLYTLLYKYSLSYIQILKHK